MTEKIEYKKSSSLFSKYEYIWQQRNNTLDSIFWFIQKYHIEMDDYGNITVTNTDAKDVPAFCCHLDTVHTQDPVPQLIKDDILLSFAGGIGGDDKCGIIACLEMLETMPCKCIFFRDEETGCKGSSKYDTESLKDNLFLIEIDRRSGTDLIFNSGGTILCDDQFKDEVKAYFPHGEEAQGTMTDVNVLGDAEINMMNLSAGYYNPHSNNEYVILSELQRNIDCLKAFAGNYCAKRKFKREVNKYYGYSSETQGTMFPGYGGYDYEYDRNDDYSATDAWYKMQFGRNWKQVKAEDEAYLRQWEQNTQNSAPDKSAKGKSKKK